VFYPAVVSIAFSLGLMVISPAAGYLAAVVSKPWIDATFDQPFVFGLPPTQVISAAVPMFVLGYIAFVARGANSFSRMPYHRMWLAWIAYAAIFSAVIADDGRLLDGANIFFRHANGLVGFYAAQAWYREEKATKSFVIALIVAGLFPMGTGVYEGITGHHWREVLGEGDLLRNVGMYHDAIAIRVYALQTLAALLMLTVLHLPRDWMWKAAVAVYSLVCVFVIYKALSKSGTLIIAAWALMWPALRRTRHSLLVVTMVIVLGALILSTNIAEKTFWIFQKEIAAVTGTGDAARTFAGRWFIWEDWLSQWNEMSAWQKIFGSGRDSTGIHNDFLMILSHGGAIGLIIYVALLTAISVGVVRNVIARATPWNVAACLMIVMWFIDSVGLVPSAYSAYQWFIWGFVGLALRKDWDGTRDHLSKTSSPATARVPLFSIVP